MKLSLKERLMPLAMPKTIGWLFVPLAIMLVVVMPGAEADLKKLSGGFGPLDLLLFYSPNTAWKYLDAYGPMGRQLYLFLELTADLAYPVFYTLFLWAVTLWLMRKTTGRPFQRSWLLPVLPFCFDILENAMLCLLLLFYPEKPILLALLASVFTLLKWVSIAVLAVLLLYLAIQVLNQKKMALGH